MIIRSKTFKSWMKSNFTASELNDIFNHGCVSGFAGLTTYTDTCKLYNKFKDEIWELALNFSEESGDDNVFQTISSFQGGNIGNCAQFENLMVWFAAEHYARELSENYDDRDTGYTGIIE